MNNFYKYIFSISLATGSLITISSVSWLTAWVGLEMNLLSILPLMKASKNKISTETMIKYFITQAIASNLLLFSIIIFMNSENSSLVSNFSMFLSLILSSALFLKMGAAPFHFWLPEVASGLPWNMLLILLTWQKLAPMILLINSMYNLIFFYTVIIFSSLVGSLMGMNQTCLRKILAYSSINHMSWMISALLISYNTWVMYFIVYSIININIIILMNKFSIYYLTQLFKFFNFNKQLKLMFMMNLFSLGGLPPFLGFLPKWTTINQLINTSSYSLSLIMITMSLLSLYYYLRLSFSSLTLDSMECLNSGPPWCGGPSITLMNFLSLSGLSAFSLVYLLF